MHQAKASKTQIQNPPEKKSKRENEKNHPRCYLATMLFNHHKDIGNTRDKQCNDDKCHQGLNNRELAVAIHIKKTGCPVITSQKTDQKSIRCLSRQSQNGNDKRGRQLLNPSQKMDCIKKKQNEGPKQEKRYGFLHVPFQMRKGFL